MPKPRAVIVKDVNVLVNNELNRKPMIAAGRVAIIKRIPSLLFSV